MVLRPVTSSTKAEFIGSLHTTTAFFGAPLVQFLAPTEITIAPSPPAGIALS